jgi:hypothetical protein
MRIGEPDADVPDPDVEVLEVGEPPPELPHALSSRATTHITDTVRLARLEIMIMLTPHCVGLAFWLKR